MHPIKYKTKLSVVTKKKKRIFNVASVLSPPILHIILISKENSDQTSLGNVVIMHLSYVKNTVIAMLSFK